MKNIKNQEKSRKNHKKSLKIMKNQFSHLRKSKKNDFWKKSLEIDFDHFLVSKTRKN